MYTDYILLGISVLCLVITVILIIYMLKSKKKSKTYKKLLLEDTSSFDAYTETANFTKSIIDTETSSLGSETETLGMDTDTLHGDSVTVAVDLGNINIDILKDKYVIEEEIHGGAMSRIFRARSIKLGNEWVIKYIDSKNASLANEENILKQLNHLNLPQIIDIFRDHKGIFLIERYIEGFPLNQVLSIKKDIGQTMVIEWAEQIAQVLSYLHELDRPIIHCDLKPSNIMVTHNNKLVLIDFGVSKQYGIDDEKAGGLTYSYAAPEQFKYNINERYTKLIEQRFGELPEERIFWEISTATDIYSLGVILFEMATGSIPTISNYDMLNDKVSTELSNIIYKCLEIAPQKRYESAKELLLDIQKIKNTKISMARTLFIRKLVASLMVASTFISGTSFGAGAYLYNQEKLSILGIDPNTVFISQQQSAEIVIEKILPNGKIKYLDPEKIQWSYSGGDIARIDRNVILGINQGTTEIYGKYRNKIITIKAEVVKPIDGITNISLRYPKNLEVRTLAGTGERELRDDSYSNSCFVSPESIATLDDGSIIITDSGKIRILKDGKTETIDFEPSYITANKVRAFKDELYILTHEWEEDGEKYYGIIKLTENGAEGLFISDAVYTKITDFTISPKGVLYFIENNLGERATYLCELDIVSGEWLVVKELEEGFSALAIDEYNNIYIANSQTGIIKHMNLQTKEEKYFAGIEGDRQFIDGNLAKFYEPKRLKIHNNQLYVLDFNVIRKITIKDEIPIFTETIVGEVTTDNNPETIDGRASDIVLAPSTLMDFIVLDERIIITDPKKSVVREVNINI